MDPLNGLLTHAEKLIGIFGYWPSFHDAEVHEIHLNRGDIRPDDSVCVLPTLMARLHVWELTSEVDARGYFITRFHTLVTLLFHEVDELQMAGFNFQNAIFGLNLRRKDGVGEKAPRLSVEFDPAFGMSATFTCSRLEVVEAILRTQGESASED